MSALKNLTDLRCSYNDLNSLDVSALTNLTTMTCRNNNLTSIDLSGLTKLDWFSCENNRVTSLILGGQTDMTQLICAYNNLTSLDLRNISLEKIRVGVNSCLQCVIVDDLNDVPQDVSGGSGGPPPYTTEPCLVPAITYKNYTVQLDGAGNASITAINVLNGRTRDICGFSSMSVSPSSFTCADVGDNEVTLTVIDKGGNESISISTVKVEDTVVPEFQCEDMTLQLDASGQAIITESDVANGTSDACGIKTMTINPNSFSCANVGSPVTVTLMATDNNDNTATCTFKVMVEDNVLPDVKCKDLTLQLDGSGRATITAADVDNGSSDACGIKSMTVSPNSFSCADVSAPLNVTLTVTDNNGNIKTCISKVTVEDNIPPEVRTHNQTVFLDKDGKAFITPEMINDVSFDNCTINSMWLEGQTEYDCSSTGVHEVILHARDQSGNTAQERAIVTVKFYKPDFERMTDSRTNI